MTGRDRPEQSGGSVTKKKWVVMVAPDWSSRGGIASVIGTYRDRGLFDEWPIRFLPSHRREGAF
jgi:hypothetical protein